MKAIYMCGNPAAIDRSYSPEVRQTLSGRLEFPPEIITKANLAQYTDFLKETSFIFSTWGMIALDERFIRESLPRLEAVFYGAGSVQGFARPFLNCGVRVVSAWMANAVPVAEVTVAQIILANKGYFQMMSKIKDPLSYKGANSMKNSFGGNFVNTVGILGAGAIGKKVIELLKSYNLKILVFDPFLPDETAARLGVSKRTLDEVFAESGVISNHLADNEQTAGMITKKQFDLMRDNAAFINTGRGAQVIEADMIAAMKDSPGRIALLDVTHPEPPLPGSELYTAPNIFISPHFAGSTGTEPLRHGEYMRDEFLLYSSEKKLRYSVTLEMLETMA